MFKKHEFYILCICIIVFVAWFLVPPLQSQNAVTRSALYQGNGTKVQLSTGSAPTGHSVVFDSNGNTIDSGMSYGTGTPTVTSGFGSGATIAVGYTDHAGKIVVGTGAGTSGVITFGETYSLAPACVGNDESNISGMKVTSTTTTLTINPFAGSMTNGDSLSWVCN